MVNEEKLLTVSVAQVCWKPQIYQSCKEMKKQLFVPDDVKKSFMMAISQGGIHSHLIPSHITYNYAIQTLKYYK